MTTILIPFHPRTRRVLAGPWFGFDAREAKQREMRRIMAEDKYEHLTCDDVIIRPWWRLWRATPAHQINLTLEGAP